MTRCVLGTQARDLKPAPGDFKTAAVPLKGRVYRGLGLRLHRILAAMTSLPGVRLECAGRYAQTHSEARRGFL
jgi:hypothetical protein